MRNSRLLELRGVALLGGAATRLRALNHSRKRVLDWGRLSRSACLELLAPAVPRFPRRLPRRRQFVRPFESEGLDQRLCLQDVLADLTWSRRSTTTIRL
jgi:hypothetical protein